MLSRQLTSTLAVQWGLPGNLCVAVRDVVRGSRRPASAVREAPDGNRSAEITSGGTKDLACPMASPAPLTSVSAGRLPSTSPVSRVSTAGGPVPARGTRTASPPPRTGPPRPTWATPRGPRPAVARRRPARRPAGEIHCGRVPAKRGLTSGITLLSRSCHAVVTEAPVGCEKLDRSLAFRWKSESRGSPSGDGGFQQYRFAGPGRYGVGRCLLTCSGTGLRNYKSE